MYKNQCNKIDMPFVRAITSRWLEILLAAFVGESKAEVLALYILRGKINTFLSFDQLK
jgi:hypothetical protein